MKLLSIKLLNFRQFYGETPKIILATSNEQNTTIIHGNNGSGKTGLLNAFTWVLYEKFTSAFSEENQLINKRAIAESEINAVECWVELFWEHGDKNYRLKRICRGYKNDISFNVMKTEVKLQVVGDDGKWFIPNEHPENIINEILPISLHQYFFFDGERIEKIVRSDKKAEIAEATKKLLGLAVLESAIRHLSEAKKQLDTELKSIGDSETKQLVKDLEVTEKELNKLQLKQEEIVKELEYQQVLKQETNQRLIELNITKELQERRQQLEKQKELLQSNIKQSKQSLKNTISRKGYSVFLGNFIDDVHQMLQQEKEEGKIKSGISQEFLLQLIQEERCICGTELHPHTHELSEVKSWLEKAGIAAISETAIKLGVEIDKIADQSGEIWQKIDVEKGNIETWRKEINLIENDLEEIKDKLRKDASEEIRNFQKRIDDIEDKIKDLHIEKGADLQKIEDFQKKINSLNKEITKQKTNEEKQNLCARRIAATQDAIARLTEVKKRQEIQFRLQLEQRLQQIFQEISFTGYVPKINEKYELILVDNSSSVVAASTGENQILSLSFIAAIIDRVREWSERKILIIPDSNTFPIVMDSPYGSLDEISRRQVAKIIPKLANQLVVLLTKTQWRGEVETEMIDRIGRQYVLTYYSTKSDCEEDYIEINGNIYPLVLPSSTNFDYTEIMEVEDNF